jgi:NAD(P)-dependent dehydrogenase (short-subunit alcohol dehydrogenase family)
LTLSRRPGPFFLDNKVHIDLSPVAGRHDQLDRRIGLRVELDDDDVTGVQGDASSLADLDRLYETVKREKGRIDVLLASAGTAEFAPIGEVTMSGST